MFDRNERPLKREAETLGWLDLPELGRDTRTPRGRIAAIIALATGASIAAAAIAIAAAS